LAFHTRGLGGFQTNFLLIMVLEFFAVMMADFNVEGTPLRDSFLFNGKINPVIALEVDYKISKKLCIHSSLTPPVIIYGLRYRL
jgi:hypothetical protein